MEDVVTIERIINKMREWVETNTPVPPSRWLDTAQRLNVLRSDLDDELYTLEHNLAVDRARIVQNETAAKANIFIEAKEEYMRSKKIRAKIKQLEEFIRISKKQATLKDNQWNDS